MIMQIPSSTIRSSGMKLEAYDPQSKLKPADPDVLAKLLENEPKTGKCDVFIRSDVPENERVKLSDGIYDKDAILEACRSSGEIGSAHTKNRVVSGMSNRELYKLLTGVDLPDRTGLGVDVDFNDWGISAFISTQSLMATDNGGSGATKESIAKYYGDIAKRLDEAYAQGKFTKEEYDLINDGIMERMEHATTCAERNAARRMVAYERSMSFKEFERRQTMTPEEYQADMEAATDKYVRLYTKIDRTALMKLFNNIRFGK